MSLTHDYEERVYAGVLGKIIGVYLGRPFEQWPQEKITATFGEIGYYVNQRSGHPLIVADDDITGTFTFLRALPDHGNRADLTPAEIGRTWLNYIIENKTILWWGGIGRSTEHTAFHRLKHGIEAPASGSIALNGRKVAEEIGAQIFIDGWAMVSPGDPERAADFARRAASVSHDGEAIYGAQVVAAMEALAFVEPKLDRLLDVAASLIPKDSMIHRLIGDMRQWRQDEPDWRKTREKITAQYGYQIFGTDCPMVSNHAIILLGLLYGGDDFQKTLLVTNTAGYDTDCNSGNVGCLMGIKNGLAAFEGGPDWRGPVADRLLLPTAEGGGTISDAVREADQIINIGRAVQGLELRKPKNDSRFHFDFPGAVQGFQVDPPSTPFLQIENVAEFSAAGTRSLAIHYRGLLTEARVETDTFPSPEMLKAGGYLVCASPTLYAGQTVRARVVADPKNGGSVRVGLHARRFGANDVVQIMPGTERELEPGQATELVWTLPETDSHPILKVGLTLAKARGLKPSGTVYLDYLTWSGAPATTIGHPTENGGMWPRAWVQAADIVQFFPKPWLEMSHAEGRGYLSIGTRDWSDYKVSVSITPRLAQAVGLAIRYQGLNRHYAFLLRYPGRATLIKVLDGTETILAERSFPWERDLAYRFELTASGTHLHAAINGISLVQHDDLDDPLSCGGMAFLVDEGRLNAEAVTFSPAS
jgi:ADP-ribosylglycohydrolase